MKIQFVVGGREVSKLLSQGEAPPRRDEVVFVGDVAYLVVDVEWAVQPGTVERWTGARVHLRELSDDEIDARLAKR